MLTEIRRISLVLPLVLTAAFGGCASSANSKPANAAATTEAATAKGRSARGVHAFEVKDIDGAAVRLDRYAGKVLLIVNVASKCGFTPQYTALEALYEKHAGEGLDVLAFPSDQFGNQEPGTEAEIKTFCRTRYSVTFPLFAKIDVNGPNAHPLYRFLRAEQPGSFRPDAPGASMLYAHLQKTTPEVLGTDAVKWNFTKFLVDRKGSVVKRFESMETPEAIEGDVVAALAAAVAP